MGFAALKLDMSKAYDRVEWKYLATIYVKIELNAKWIQLLCDYVETSQFSFKVNGSIRGRVVLSRDIHQGCPLSPYLFLLCVESLSSLFHNAIATHSLHGFACSKGGPIISHPFFQTIVWCFVKHPWRKGEKLRRS